MSRRLDITLFGTMYRVGAICLSRSAAKKGMEVYGLKKWNDMVNAIALEREAEKLLNQVNHTLGQKLEIVYRARGIVMQSAGFGLEIFHGGKFVPLDVVEAENRTLQPRQLVKDCTVQEMLGVFWARREGAMFFRWEDADIPRPEDIVLTHEGLAPLMGRGKHFDLITDITWQGKSGRRWGKGTSDDFEPPRHVFHMSK